MIERARATGLYAELEVDDLVQGLRHKPDASAELILAADAMVYVADLAPVLGEASRVLVADGTLAFTVESHDSRNGGENGGGVLLGEVLRYSHSADYVRATLRAAGLRLAHCGEASARNEDNVPAPGLVLVATKD
jgi:predicted TPR repeat methyltransferase